MIFQKRAKLETGGFFTLCIPKVGASVDGLRMYSIGTILIKGLGFESSAC